MRNKLAILFFLLPALLVLGDSSTGPGGPYRGRGKKTGDYLLQVVGTFTGDGTAQVLDDSVAIKAQVRLADGSSGLLILDNAALRLDRFTGTGTILGGPCTVSGRVDLPSATDAQTSDDQAFTGRIVATVRDASGRVSRIVGIQEAASRSVPPLPPGGGAASGGGPGGDGSGGDGDGGHGK